MQKKTSVKNRIRYLVDAGVIAAIHGVATIISLSSLSYFSWGPIQLRPSEALMVLVLFNPAAVPGLTLGCFFANLFNLTAAGPLGWLDVVFGTAATLAAGLWMRRFRTRANLALFGPVLFNALIVAAYLPLILMGLGLYNIPLLDINIESSYLLMYVFGVVTIGIGQAIVVYGLGVPLKQLTARYNLFSGEELK